MFAPDPIDLFDPSPYFAISYYGHLLIGLIAIVAAIIAFSAKKGGKWHIRSGKIFIIAVLVVCTTTASMLSDAFIPPLFLAAVSAVYVVLTAYLALKPGTRWVRYSEYGLSAFELLGVVAFLSLALPNVAAGEVPLMAPMVLIAIPAILLAGDINWFLKHDRRRQLRLRRHLARMVWAIIIVVRAPLVEVAAAGLPIPAPVILFGPFVIAGAVLLWLQPRFSSKTAKP